jgi:alkyl hydroperoxide reductase subunit AhpF
MRRRCGCSSLPTAIASRTVGSTRTIRATLRPSRHADLPKAIRSEWFCVGDARSNDLARSILRARSDSISSGRRARQAISLWLERGRPGLSAAVYGASEGLSTLVVEDTAIGGQAGTSSRIENYVGFPAGISGEDLAFRAEVQSIKFGAHITVPRRATALERRDNTYAVRLDDGSVLLGRSIVIATGARYRRLSLRGQEAFEGAGIYYAATELEARLCRKREVVVVGGGNSSGQAAMFLSQYASCVRPQGARRAFLDYQICPPYQRRVRYNAFSTSEWKRPQPG